MRGTLVIIYIFIFKSITFSQTSPHGDKLKFDCADCHTTNDWTTLARQMKFDHDKTFFKLVGQHSQVNCKSCHQSLVFSDAKTDCNSCHKDVHQNTVGPDCERCHSSTTWVISEANQMHEKTRFPLVGVHQNVDCASCHSGYSKLYFPPLAVSCYSCHSQQYFATTSPNHVQAQFSTQCQDCHGAIDISWGPTNFDHSFFPLTCGHAIQNCFACHKQGNNNFKGLSTNCYSCHQADFASATNPNHVAQGFSHQCDQCHTTTDWTSAGFDHTAAGFPLTLGHANLQCVQCHAAGFTNTPSTCVSCHQTDYNNTNNPSHITLALPTGCTTCHTTNPGWTPATFPIHSNYYVITGAHASLTCDQCHNGNYNVAPTTCYGCHTNDYNSTNNPPHQSAGYPTDCTQCHTQTAWTPSTFNHTQFPITSGNHASPPLLCSQCHTTISNFAIFSCTTSGCHTEASTDPHHSGVRNYVYSPTSCYSCHPTGTGD